MQKIKTAYNQTVSMEGEGSEKGIAFTLVEQDNGSEWVFFDSVLNKTPQQAVQEYLDDRRFKDEIVYNPEYDTYEVEGLIRACTMYIQI